VNRSNPWSWLARFRLVIIAAAPALACVSGIAEPFEDTGASQHSAGSSFAGAGTIQAGSTSVSGATASGGSPPGMGGTQSVAGSGTQGGMPGTAGSSVSMGGMPAEICNFPAWMAGKDYAAGDKVMFMGKAYVATEANPGYDPVVSSFFWSPYSCEPSGNGGSGGGGPVINDGDCVLEKLLPAGETTFHDMFIPPWQGHQEKPLYSYAALCTALKGFGQFANSGDVEKDKREIAAFFAHVAKETAFLEQTDEAGQASNSPDFHGRGAIQLTGQSNYQAAGSYLQKDLVANPGLVSTDSVINWQTALWFWVVHSNPGTAGVQNCHQAISGGDFAQTTRIINGGIECPGSQSAITRADYYKNNCSKLGVSPGSSLVC
jgi:predicted chitinase